MICKLKSGYVYKTENGVTTKCKIMHDYENVEVLVVFDDDRQILMNVDNISISVTGTLVIDVTSELSIYCDTFKEINI